MNGNYSEKDNYPEYIEKVFEFKIPPGQSPERLDQYLSRSIINATRTKVQKAIDSGHVTVNGKSAKVSRKIKPDDLIICKIMRPPPIELIPENIPIEIAYEDNSMLVVNKPAGMVTHPGFGNRYGTLVNAVLYYFGERETISVTTEDDDDDEEIDEGMIFSSDAVRPGVVHRLDKDTSGLLIVSKNPVAHAKLAAQFADRSISRIYYAIVWGKFTEDSGTFEGDIGRSSRDRKLFTVVKKGGKQAITDWEVVERYDYATLLKIKLRTGRTHQIRVHFAYNNRPVFGDPDYGGNKIVYGGNSKKWKDMVTESLGLINRQMLHAKNISFIHPETKKKMEIECDLPKDILFIRDKFSNY